MPTTLDEAKEIRAIVGKYLADDKAAELFKNLLKIAYSTDNYSVRSSLIMIYRLYDFKYKMTLGVFENLYWTYDKEYKSSNISSIEYTGIDENMYKELYFELFKEQL